MELFKPDAGLFFWMLLSFLILFLILGKYAWPAITKGINERNQHIDEALKSAQKAQEKLEEMQKESANLISQAKEAQIKILQEGKKLKEQILIEAKEQAKEEAGKIIEDAYTFISKQKEDAAKNLDKKVAELSVDIAELILQKKLENPEEQKALAEKLVKNISDN